MLAGHCDQIGFIINYIDADGFLYFLQLGGWDPQVVTGQRVVVYGRKGPVNGVIGKKPIHLLNEEERKHVMKIQDLWIDIGAPDRNPPKSWSKSATVPRSNSCRESPTSGLPSRH